jgi:hypothetical protein
MRPGPEHDRGMVTRLAGRFAARVLVVSAAAALAACASSASGPTTHPATGGAQPADGPTTVTSGRAQEIAVHDGDLVRATGNVVAVPGKPVRFCSPLVAVTGNEPFGYCPTGVVVVGADLKQLHDRRTHDGTVRGSATITGIFREGAIEVRHQVARRFVEPVHFADDSVPCARPAEGWPDRQPPLGAVYRYRRSHPGSIVEIAYLNPSEKESLVYVLTAGDPAPVQDALGAAYPHGVCVRKSEYTAQQIKLAHRFTIALMRVGNPLSRPYEAGGGGLGDDDQPRVSMSVAMVDDRLAQKVDAQPAGLVEIIAWLVPIS